MAEYYLMTEATPHVVSSAFVVASVIVGDVIMVRAAPNGVLYVVFIRLVDVQAYRVWIVWNKKFVSIIFPALCIFAYIGEQISVMFFLDCR